MIDPQLAIPAALAALFLLASVATTITVLALERAKRAEDRATLAETLLDRCRPCERPGPTDPKE